MSSLKSVLLASAATLLFSAAARAQSQVDINAQACQKYQQSDAQLNRVYNQVLSEYAQEAAFVAKLKKAQRAWVAYRDAHLEALYPATDKSEYGSVYPSCRCQVLTGVTDRRTEVLRLWLEGVKEGEVCSGSIKVKN